MRVGEGNASLALDGGVYLSRPQRTKAMGGFVRVEHARCR